MTVLLLLDMCVFCYTGIRDSAVGYIRELLDTSMQLDTCVLKDKWVTHVNSV